MTPTGDPTWTLTRQSLERLLRRLGPDAEAAAREYDVIRRRLIDFFDGRGSACSDVLADETMDRVARRLDEGERVDSLRGYVFGVARRVVLEWAKRQPREAAAHQALRAQAGDGPAVLHERQMACLERCLESLPS